MRPPFRFHCFKCETSGVLNGETFRDLGIYNTDLSVGVINANKNIKLQSSKSKFQEKKLKNEPIRFCIFTEFSCIF